MIPRNHRDPCKGFRNVSVFIDFISCSQSAGTNLKPEYCSAPSTLLFLFVPAAPCFLFLLPFFILSVLKYNRFIRHNSHTIQFTYHIIHPFKVCNSVLVFFGGGAYIHRVVHPPSLPNSRTFSAPPARPAPINSTLQQPFSIPCYPLPPASWQPLICFLSLWICLFYFLFSYLFITCGECILCARPYVRCWMCVCVVGGGEGTEQNPCPL